MISKEFLRRVSYKNAVKMISKKLSQFYGFKSCSIPSTKDGSVKLCKTANELVLQYEKLIDEISEKRKELNILEDKKKIIIEKLIKYLKGHKIGKLEDGRFLVLDYIKVDPYIVKEGMRISLKIKYKI